MFDYCPKVSWKIAFTQHCSGHLFQSPIFLFCCTLSYKIGNALRRVLLSSLPGTAIVNVKIQGVEQEIYHYSGVYEDVMTIILNLKKNCFLP
ncbi:hypothetical protein ACEW7V_02445 [Areca yellow leaf disease phytoplasma]|uniref:hypothetical protein n=1 Tax=Areca yellow leaf disease phytoplasma TaxID=927614 RepID=UPI0035B56C82